MAAVFTGVAVAAGQEAVDPRLKFLVMVAYGTGLVAVISLYLCFATIWLWWPTTRSSPEVSTATKATRSAEDGVSHPETATSCSKPGGSADQNELSDVDIGKHEPGRAKSEAEEVSLVHVTPFENPRLKVRLDLRPIVLVGREEILADIHSRLTSGDSPWPRISVLHGLAGAGKTSLALEYAHRNLNEVDLVWQFTGEDPAVLMAGFSALQANLGIYDPTNVVESVHTALAASSAEWLLIFDNVLDRSAIEEFLPRAGRGRILVTSQNASWPFGQGISVPVLSTDVAASFLMKRTSDPDLQSARALAELLGGLPLALEQAAAYMQVTEDKLIDYLALFRRRRHDVLTRGVPTGYPRTVAATLRLAIDRLNQASPEAVGLLRLAACCASEAIPLRILLVPRTEIANQVSQRVASMLLPLLEDELLARDAVAALRRLSLVTPAGGGSVSIHRLVQAATLGQMAEDLIPEWRHAASVIVEMALPANSRLPETWPTFAALLPHFQAVLPPYAAALTTVADYLGRSGSYLAARDLYEKVAIAQTSQFGREAPETLASLNGLARWTGQKGNKEAARDMLAELLPVEEDALGVDDPLTLETRSSIARWTGEAGDPERARDLFGALLSVEERVMGPEDPETLETRSAVARWTGEAGNAADARDLFVEALPIEERVLGPEHPQSLDTRSCIARWTGHAGDPSSARDQLTELMPRIVRALGPEHPRTLAYKDNLAYWTWQAGDPADAQEMFTELLRTMERVLGKESRQTKGTRANLARSTRAARRGGN